MTAPPTVLVLTILLLFFRFFIAVRMMPFLDGKPLPLIAVGVVAVAMTVFCIPWLNPTGVATQAIPLLVVKELFVGLMLGISVKFIFSVLHIVGGLTNLYAVATDAPGTPEYFVKLYFIIGIGLFVALDGHHALILAVIQSLRVVPPLGPTGIHYTSTLFFPLMINMFVGAFQFGVLIAAPMFVAALLVEMVAAFWNGIRNQGRSTLASFIRGYCVQVAIVLFMWKTVSVLVRYLAKQMETLGQLQ